MTKKKYLPYNCQAIHRNDIKAVSDAMKGDFISRGPIVEEFEKAIADYCGASYAVAFNSGTTALSAAYFAADLTSSDRLFTSPNTFIGTVTGALQKGCTLRLVDINHRTGNLSLDKLSETINQPTTRGRDIIVPVHFSGIPIDMICLNQMVRRADTVIIEDGAHALGSSYANEQKVGCCAESDMTIFSLDPVKNITAGEGGLVTTNSEKLYEKLKIYRGNGMVRNSPWDYQITALTGNYFMTDFQAALGLSQLGRIEESKKSIHGLVNAYHKALDGIEEIQFLDYPKDGDIFYHLFPILIDFEKVRITRTELMEKLHEEGIGTQVNYIPLYKHKVLKPYVSSEEFEGMEEYYSKVVSLPLHLKVDKKDVKLIGQVIKKLIQGE